MNFLCFDFLKNKVFIILAGAVAVFVLVAMGFWCHMSHMHTKHMQEQEQAKALEASLKRALREAQEKAEQMAKAKSTPAGSANTEVKRLQDELNKALEKVKQGEKTLQTIQPHDELNAQSSVKNDSTVDAATVDDSSYSAYDSGSDAAGATTPSQSGSSSLDPEEEFREKVAFAQALEDAARDGAQYMPNNSQSINDANDGNHKSSVQTLDANQKRNDRPARETQYQVINNDDEADEIPLNGQQIARDDRQGQQNLLNRGIEQSKQELLRQQAEMAKMQLQREINNRIHEQLNTILSV